MAKGGAGPIFALAASVIAAVLLSACGDSGSGPVTTQGSTGSTAASKNTNSKSASTDNANSKGQSPTQPKGASGAQGGKSPKGDSEPQHVATPLKVSGGGSSQFRTKGGDNSIQNYGGESDEEELRLAAESLHGFYVARAEGDWTTACSHLSTTLIDQFETLASRSNLKGGCPETLDALTAQLPRSLARESTEVDAISLRQGDDAFLIYRGMEGKVYATTMKQEDGTWKVGSLGPVPIG